MNNENSINNRLRAIPSISKIMEAYELNSALGVFGRKLFKMALAVELSDLRKRIIAGAAAEFDYSAVFQQVIASLSAICDSSARRVINGTGIILHTGLGRAPLAAEAVTAMIAAARYTPVQTDLATGKRSLRERKIELLLQELTGAEAVTVVNNNAAATMLVLNTLAANKKVVISRGQLVEIGGAFRMPDVMRMSGAIMKEIGTTNRTHLKDYSDAFDEDVGVLLHVHTSNYRLRGFGGTPEIAEIVTLARELGVCAVDDLGSGALVPLHKWGIESEPLVRDSIACGVDLCCFSGDKLIGGAQSGIICGKAEYIEQVRKNPFARMFRVDKITLAALEATLAIWVDGKYAEKIPLYMMLSLPKKELEGRAREFVGQIAGKLDAVVRAAPSMAYIGSGSLPDSGVDSWSVVLELTGLAAEEGARTLRSHGVFSRVNDGAIWIDMIALLDGEFDLAIARVIAAFGR